METQIIIRSASQANNTGSPQAFVPALRRPASGEPRACSAALVSMPFGSSRLPSIQVGLLTAMARNEGWKAQGLYANLLFAKTIGWDRYELICEQRFRLLGEWLFSVAAFADAAPPDHVFLELSELGAIEKTLGLSATELHDWRHKKIPDFIDELASLEMWEGVSLVGFTSMFEQSCASLALARALKRRYPDLLTVFGGANFDGSMGVELIRKIDWIDCVVVGEAEQAFPELLKQISGKNPLAAIAGVLWRASDEPGPPPEKPRAPITIDMDAVPTPQYDDFFATLARTAAPREVMGRWTFIPFESARGCWWGERSHCTFCGLNANGMAYRSKSPPRVLQELDALAKQYGAQPFFAVDNILDHRYIDEVFGSIERKELDYTFWYELKANLKPEQIRALARGGLTWAQPGIETLSSNVLKLMRKGSTSFINLRFIKWAHYYGIRVAWNVLYGFPGETTQDYSDMAKLIELVGHLPPPDDCGPIRMDRFSPYHNQPQQWGLSDIRPDPRYAAVYASRIDPNEIAYYFEFDNPSRLSDATYAPLRSLIENWQARWSNEEQRPKLNYTRTAAQIRFFDSRSGSPTYHYFGAIESTVYPLIGRNQLSASQLFSLLREHEPDITVCRIDAALMHLEQEGLLWREGDVVIGLALPARPSC